MCAYCFVIKVLLQSDLGIRTQEHGKERGRLQPPPPTHTPGHAPCVCDVSEQAWLQCPLWDALSAGKMLLSVPPRTAINPYSGSFHSRSSKKVTPSAAFSRCKARLWPEESWVKGVFLSLTVSCSVLQELVQLFPPAAEMWRLEFQL